MESCFNPVVMAGGVGSRLWPLSRASFPKQYQQLIPNDLGHTMVQQTFARLSGLVVGRSQLICNQEHRFLAAEQCRSANIDAEILLEPVGRNTAPAVIIAALRLIEFGKNEPMLVLSADHSITDQTSFRSALITAHQLAILGNLVTLGIKPHFACTGYGYIRFGDEIGNGFKVNEFVEKPNAAIAQNFISEGNYFWNSGMFIVKPSVLIEEAELYCPDLLQQCKLAFKSIDKDLDFFRLSEQEFIQCQSISLDYAIMEYTKKAVVVPVECGWSDVGDLKQLWEAIDHDSRGNVLEGDVIAVDTHDCLVKTEYRLVAVLGVNGLAVIETKDVILVVPLNKAQQIKELVVELEGRQELINQREVYRPWGSYDCIDTGLNYQVKRLSVIPGQKLSLQRHKYRAEHWVVVNGLATVYLDGNEHTLKANDSIYIEVGAIHSLANNTSEPLNMIEVQSGSYLGEDDIERFEDIYGRN